MSVLETSLCFCREHWAARVLPLLGIVIALRWFAVRTPAWLEAAFTVALGAVLACLHALAAGDVPTTALLKQGAFAGAVAAVYLWMPRRCEKVGA